MQIYPDRQLLLLLCAFMLGVAQGLVWELFVAVRILLGAHLPPERYLALYKRPLPLLGRSVPLPAGRGRRVWRGSVRAVCDVLYCICFALALILLLYDQNDGAWRLSVPVLALLGLAAFRVVFARPLCALAAYTAFFLAAGGVYIRVLLVLPIRGMRHFVTRLFVRPIRALFRVLYARMLSHTSAALCRAQLAAAATGFARLPLINKRKKINGKAKEENNADAMDHPRTHRGHIRGRARHWRGEADGAEPPAKGKRRAGKGEA